MTLINKKIKIESILIKACRDGDFETVKSLFSNVKKEITSEWNDEDFMNLMYRSSGLNVTEKDTLRTPLHYAVNIGNYEIVSLLIKMGAYVNPKDKSQSTPLHLACENNDIRIIDILIQNKANPCQENYFKQTAWNLIKGENCVEIYKVLLKSGSKPKENHILNSKYLRKKKNFLFSFLILN